MTGGDKQEGNLPFDIPNKEYSIGIEQWINSTLSKIQVDKLSLLESSFKKNCAYKSL